MFNRKMVLLYILLWGLFIAVFSPPSHAQSQYSACGHHDYPPWNWHSSGQIVGVCAEVTQALFKKLGVTIDLSYQGPWRRCQKNIELAKVDINICSFINTKRAQYSTFTKTPMGFNEQVLFVAKGREFSFERLSDLDNKVIGLVLGVSIGQKFDDYVATSSVTVQRLANYQQAFEMLKLGRIDAVPIARYSGRVIIQELGLARDLIELPVPLLRGLLYLSIANSSPLLEKLPQIEAIMQTQEYLDWVEQLKMKYTEQYQHYKADQL